MIPTLDPADVDAVVEQLKHEHVRYLVSDENPHAHQRAKWTNEVLRRVGKLPLAPTPPVTPMRPSSSAPEMVRQATVRRQQQLAIIADTCRYRDRTCKCNLGSCLLAGQDLPLKPGQCFA